MHRRQSIRLQGYDYSQAGAYFVTICVQNRHCLFGNIVDENMCLNDAGLMINRWYRELQHKFPDIQCGDFVCMPNHVHFIVINIGADLRVCPNHDTNLRMGESPNGGEHMGSPLPRVVQWFKTMTTNAYIDGIKHHHWQSFYKRLWQRNYYEHIIRNETDLNHIQQYIKNNPELWSQDTLHPDMGEFAGIRNQDRHADLPLRCPMNEDDI